MKTVKLAKLAAKRGLVGGPFGSSLVSKDYVDSGVPVIRGANMVHGPHLGGDFVYVSQTKVERDLARNTAAPGDVIFTQRGTLGQVALVPRGTHETFVVSQSQMRLRVDSAVALPEFVYYASTTSHFLRQIADRAITTGVPHTNLGILAELEIPDIPLPQQRAIAQVLGALDDKIAANAKLIAAGDRLAEAKTKASVDPLTRVPLLQLAVVTMGSSPPGESLNEDGTGTVFYQGVRDFGIRTPTPRVWTESVTRRAQAGDTLLSVRAPVGRVNVADDAVCIGRGLASIRSTTSAPWTLFNLLKAHPELWAPFDAEGTIFSSINRAALQDLAVPAVLPASAAGLEEELTAIELLIAAHDRASNRLAALRDALLPELMSGRLRIKDAEWAVEEAV